MTHKDIYTKFMIEYDKANLNLSNPSLTEYEAAVVLDKAYNALIAQKVTGNNPRRVSFELDLKAIEDLSPLVVYSTLSEAQNATNVASNVVKFTMPEHLYFVAGYLSKTCDYSAHRNNGKMKISMPNTDGPGSGQAIDPGAAQPGTGGDHIFDPSNPSGTDDQQLDTSGDNTSTETQVGIPMDNETERSLPVYLVTHQIAQQFFSTAYNMPWIKNPVCYIESEKIGNVYKDELYVVYDSWDKPKKDSINIVYIKKPNPFVKTLPDDPNTYISFFDPGTQTDTSAYEFELNDTMAEELISLAVTFALENVESPRLNSKLNMRGLEA